MIYNAKFTFGPRPSIKLDFWSLYCVSACSEHSPDASWDALNSDDDASPSLSATTHSFRCIYMYVCIYIY